MSFLHPTHKQMPGLVNREASRFRRLETRWALSDRADAYSRAAVTEESVSGSSTWLNHVTDLMQENEAAFRPRPFAQRLSDRLKPLIRSLLRSGECAPIPGQADLQAQPEKRGAPNPVHRPEVPYGE